MTCEMSMRGLFSETTHVCVIVQRLTSVCLQVQAQPNANGSGVTFGLAPNEGRGSGCDPLNQWSLAAYSDSTWGLHGAGCVQGAVNVNVNELRLGFSNTARNPEGILSHNNRKS
jgi:hypothetical protein